MLKNCKTFALKQETLYFWRGINALGEPMQACEYAKHRQALAVSLLNRNIICEKILPASLARWIQAYPSIAKKTLYQALLDLAELLATGIHLAEALKILSDSYPDIALLFQQIHLQIIQGQALHQAFEKFPEYFSEEVCQLIAAGEASGQLAEQLKQLASSQLTFLEFKAKITAALMYPSLIILSAIVVISFMLVFVLPRFVLLFSSFGAKLPWFSQLVISVLGNLKYVVMPSGIVIGIGFILLKIICQKYVSVAMKKQAIIWRLPLIGRILYEIQLSFLLLNFARLLQAGIPILQALALLQNMTKNLLFKTAILEIRHDLSQGQSLSQSLLQQSIWPQSVLQLIKIAEASGRLDVTLEKLGLSFQTRSEVNMAQLVKLIEPSVMIGICVIIGVIITALYLPLFQMGQIV